MRLFVTVGSMLPFDRLVRAIDGIAAPPIRPANDQVDAPIDAQLKSEIIQTRPGG